MDRLTGMMRGMITSIHLQKRMNRKFIHVHGWQQHFKTHQNQTQREIENKTREWSTYICKIEFLHRRTSKINTKHLKPIIKPFDTRWSYILDLSFKLILLLVIWSCNCNNAVKKIITHLETPIVQVCRLTFNIIPQWISKPQIRKPKNHRKSSSGKGRLAQKFRACKRSQYDVQSCKSGRHNRRHTFNRRGPRYKPISTNIPYNGWRVKEKNSGDAKTPSPCKRNWMLCSFNHN